MQFWDAQDRAKRTSFRLYIAFFAMTLIAASAAEFIVRSFSPDYAESADGPVIAFFFVLGTVVVALFNYTLYQSQGGKVVAKSLGAYLNEGASLKERELQNLIEEIALAAAYPVPEVYILENPSINAFAAGTNPENACICVTTGALERLTRDEMQGVIAHEFSHLTHRDVVISMRLAAMLMGFFFLTYIALRMLQFSPRGNDKKSPTALIAIAFLLAGALSWFFGKILSSMVSRQREYLADASAVQFTRNPQGLIGALRKIEAESKADTMPKEGMAFTHLYFSHSSFFGNLFATHPPLEKRIEVLEGK